MRVRWLAVFSCLLAAFAVGMTACGGDDDEGGGDSGGSGSGTVNVYSSLPLQGASRPQTTALVDGIKLALEQRGGKVGRRTVKYTSLDDSTAQAGTWTPEATQANARKVAQDDAAIAYIGEFNSGASAISIPLLNEVPIAQISPANTAVGLTSDEPGADEGEPGEVLPDGRAPLPAHRAQGHHPGRRTRDAHEGRRLHQAGHPERQGGLRGGPVAEHRGARPRSRASR